MPLTVSLSTYPGLLGKAENAGDQKVSQQTVNAELRAAVVAIAAKTPVNVSGGLFFATQNGKNGAGALTLTGAKVGDKVVGVTQLTTTFQSVAGSFEATITVADQIQQSAATDFSAVKIQFVLVQQS